MLGGWPLEPPLRFTTINILGENMFSVWNKGEREREMFYLTTHSTHFIYGYMASDVK